MLKMQAMTQKLKSRPKQLPSNPARDRLAEGNRSRTYQTRIAYLTGFEVRAPHRGRCPSVGR